MIDIKGTKHIPTIEEISEYIGNQLFDQFLRFMDNEYKALYKIEYSKDSWLPGWNIKLRKAGKGLCVIYPKKNYFTVLVVISSKEKNKVEELIPKLSATIQDIYYNTKEGNGQRRLMINLKSADCIYNDTLKLISIRRNSR